ncbi:MAG: DNA mismatch repair endonuclease MutL, partial [Alphaproteobacteria bacterium]|nr:DNA mismatch repair endonuclease MutL [Alphaproteobacteria bacterium]
MTIRVLPSNLVNQIAAGEVIERPSSVVKELVENAIDAGASKIEVNISGGGKNLISVQDNGGGMTPQELELAVERHATSKLPGDDLFDINFLGFRGEALPSVASVAKLRVVSRKKDAAEAYEINVNGGEKEKVMPSAAGEGTRIEVRDLFYTIPARLKFLKSDASEAAQCVDMLQRIALANPNISFYLYSDGKKKLALNAVDGDLFMTRQQRIADVMGNEFVENSAAINAQNEFCNINGIVSLPTYHKANSLSEFLFVNNRPVRDKLILGAIKGAYQDLMMSGRYPACVIFIEVNPRYVDVNVHPTKAEVRFYDNGAIRGMLVSSIRQAMSTEAKHSADTGGLEHLLEQSIAAQSEAADLRSYEVHSPQREFQSLSSLQGSYGKYSRTTAIPELEHKYSVRVPEAPTAEIIENVGELGLAKAQFHNTYIISQTEDSIVIVDQHAAHERITMEKMKQSLDKKERMPSQMLLLPEVVDLSLSEKENILEFADNLAQ